MKNKTEVSSTDVCVRMSKAGLEGGGLGIMEKRPPSPHSPPLSPPTSATTPPSQTKIKCESPVPLLSSHTPSPRPLVSPPNTGPGAEVKGKPGTPIPSGSTKTVLPRPGSASGDEAKVSVTTGSSPTTTGGRLTFFKEGKFLLELSHRTDMGAPAGWVPVKSKTYWPPPSSATTTTTQHPLRHDTPTSQSGVYGNAVSDDCSSLNSSPWTGEHLRKQLTPRRNKAFVLQQVSFHWHALPLTRDIRKRVRLRRNPFTYINGPVGCWNPSENAQVSRRTIKSESYESALEERKHKLETRILVLVSKLGLKVDPETSIQALFEKPVASAEAVDPTFVSPRKRYLRQMESDQESIHRKKLHSGANSVSHVPGENLSSSSSSTQPRPPPNRSAINSLTSSVYSIESILNNETANRKNDSFLRTLLKPEPKPSGTQSKSSVVRDRVNNEVLASTFKVERQERTDRGAADRLEQLSAGQIERTDSLVDLNRLSTERYDFSRYGPMASLYSLHPYLDPRYMMLQSLAPGLVSPISSQHTEMAQAVAAATAAAAAAAAAGLGTYPLGHFHPSLTGSQYPHLSGSLSSGYTPPTSIAAQLLRPQAQSSRSSPHAMSHSPSPKPHIPNTPASPHLSRGASPRGASSPWQPHPSVHPHSPHRPLSSPLPSPPPQDAPLNLSKPRNHMEK
ncbi:protein hairless-like isoform X2 [Homarus americanus]|uniref:protein hairless-like isoform X2 n=1 Tax=Homarus americanus TaxID=6706 RepID=UPI001C460A84|nr:protein hairless-like isoform X2 [Homarus americanus]